MQQLLIAARIIDVVQNISVLSIDVPIAVLASRCLPQILHVLPCSTPFTL
jgi:hypothetical protein